MQTKQQKRLEGLEAYPERPKMFAIKYGRFLCESQAAKEIGTAGVWLLNVIALEEDKRFCNPASLRNGELIAAMGGYSERALIDLRDKLEAEGWLYQRKGNRFRAAAYWVKIPSQFTELWNRVCGGTGLLSTEVKSVDSKLTESCPSVQTSAYIPIPREPIPEPPPQSGGAVEDLTEMLRKAFVRHDPAGTIRKALKQGRTVDQIRARIQYFLDHVDDPAVESSAAWTAGWLRVSLMREDLATVQADEAWPANPAPAWKDRIEAERRAKAARQAKDFKANRDDQARKVVKAFELKEQSEAQRRQQLELQFDPILRAMPTVEIADRFKIEGKLREFLTYQKRWQDLRVDSVKLQIMEIVAKHLEPAGRAN